MELDEIRRNKVVSGGSGYLRAIFYIFNRHSMVASTREERQRRVLELHNQGMGTREIAQILQISFRDIGVFLRDADERKEVEQQQKRQEFLSSKAYKLFSEGKSAVQVAIDLNIKAQQTIIFQREYWDLKGIHELNQIYEEIKGDPWPFVEIHKLMKDARRGPQHVNRLLEIANNDLPVLERRYILLQQQVNSLELSRSNLAINSGYYHARCEKEMIQMNRLSNERMRLEALVTNFKTTNEEYLKIKKTVERKARPILTGSKTFLRYALCSLIESMKKDPDKYSSIMYPEMYPSATSTTAYASQYHAAFTIQKQQEQHPSTDYYSDGCLDMLIEEADKVYKKLAKEWLEGSITDYAASTPLSLLPPLPSPDDEKGGTESDLM
jgi:transposase